MREFTRDEVARFARPRWDQGLTEAAKAGLFERMAAQLIAYMDENRELRARAEHAENVWVAVEEIVGEMAWGIDLPPLVVDLDDKVYGVGVADFSDLVPLQHRVSKLRPDQIQPFMELLRHELKRRKPDWLKQARQERDDALAELEKLKKEEE